MPAGPTAVTYPSGAVEGRAGVLDVVPLGDGRAGVSTDVTPFHPVDDAWPDQPADLGELRADGVVHPVVDCVTAARPAGGGPLRTGADLPRRDADGWCRLVLHVVPGPGPAPGAVADLRVDAERRAALSAGHTGCHLMALALNAALTGRWRKEARYDSLGHPDFDQLAITSSHIHEDGSTDRYRIGKSLRKKGFAADDLAGALPEITARVNERLSGWAATGAPVMIDRDGPLLTDRRYWTCALPEGRAVLPCGGTHLRNVAQLCELTCAFSLSADGTELTAHTKAVRTVTAEPIARTH